SPAGEAREALQDRYRLGSLLGRGGFGSVYSGTRLSDGAPVAIKCVPRARVQHWGELPNGARAPLEIVLLDRLSSGCGGIIQLLEWVELPNSFLLVLERPERCQDLSGFLAERRFLPEEEARGLFRQVLEAVRHCTSCGVLHRDIKPENILLDLATGQLKLIDFGCGAFLQDTAYRQFAGTLPYSPPEWIHHQRYHGEAATIWSLGLLLYHLVMGKHPFRRGQQFIWGRILFPRWLSQECQNVIRRCLSMQPLDRPSLEDLFSDPWLQGVHLPQKMGEVHVHRKEEPLEKLYQVGLLLETPRTTPRMPSSSSTWLPAAEDDRLGFRHLFQTRSLGPNLQVSETLLQARRLQ
ncbi:serine/threonine-protein kinase pim-1-like, partial [Chamaea fasciata]|uniref:serine/threonine-protein kinase pim-1-like n=1 Tax=Chamaea fasciata TaxID=190680 RepID=UPI003369FBBE